MSLLLPLSSMSPRRLGLSLLSPRDVQSTLLSVPAVHSTFLILTITHLQYTTQHYQTDKVTMYNTFNVNSHGFGTMQTRDCGGPTWL